MHVRTGYRRGDGGDMNCIRARLAVSLALIAVLSMFGEAAGQERTVLQGRILDSTTGEPLIGAQVIVAGTDPGGVTYVEGRYRLQLEAGSYRLDVQYLGYAANVEPFFCGKPQDVFFTKLCEKLCADPTRCILIRRFRKP